MRSYKLDKYTLLLERISTLKKDYQAKEFKLNSAAVITLLMAGVLDSLFETPPTILERHEAIARFQKASKTAASLESTRLTKIAIADIDSEMMRKIWTSEVNPLHHFRMCDEYRDALQTLSFVELPTPNMRFRLEKSDIAEHPIDIFGDFRSLFSPKVIEAVTRSKYMKRLQAVVGLYDSCEIKTWGAGNKMKKVLINDGSSSEAGVIWPARGSQDRFPPKMEHVLKCYKGKPCLFIGKVGAPRNGYNSFTLDDIIPLA